MKIRLSTLITLDKKTIFILYSVHSTFGQRSFKFHGASLWNELPNYPQRYPVC